MTDDPVRIGLVADTHIPHALPCLPESLGDILFGVTCILHAGDLVSMGVIEDLAALAPATAVRGNCDPPEVSHLLADRLMLPIRGHRIGVHHGHQRAVLQNQYVGLSYDGPEFELFCEAMSTQLPDCDVIVFGHFHVPVVREWHGILFVNPGSVAPPHARPTCAILELGEQAAACIYELP
jgi:putative phosphoesterase